jgi:hypothetical protein
MTVKIRVILPVAMQHHRLPEPPHGAALKHAIEAVLRWLDLAPAHVMAPLFAATYRAPLGVCDLSVHITGITGLFKSEVVALAQQHYGAGMDARHLPASWSSTDTALSELAFRSKDSLMTIDDYIPTGSPADVQRLNRKADNVLRGQGNNAGRGRCYVDGSLRPPKPPRGLILSTGEDTPQGQSLRARMLVVEVAPGDVDKARLTQCQKDARNGYYAQSMAAYIQWLAPQYEDVYGSLREEIEELRALATGQHARTPEVVANLALGLRYFLQFARASEVISAAKAEELWRWGWGALLQAGDRQSAHQAASEPTRRYLELLASALASGRAHVADIEGHIPANPAAWGWREAGRSGAYPQQAWEPQGERIGWLESEDLYLNPDAAYHIVKKLGDVGTDGIAIGSKTLNKRLHEHGLLKSTDKNHGTLTIQKTVNGKGSDAKRQAVLHLHSNSILHTESPQSPQAPAASHDRSTGADNRGAVCEEIL